MVERQFVEQFELSKRTMNPVVAASRSLLLVTAILLGVPHVGQECDDLKGHDLTVCLTLMVCMSLEENKARNQCLEVTRQILDKHEAQSATGNPAESVEVRPTTEELEPSAEPKRANRVGTLEIVDKPVTVETETGSEMSTSAPQATNIEGTDTQKSLGRRLFSWMRRGERKAREDNNKEAGLTRDGVPKQFAATVVAVAPSGYNDLLVVLSNGFVFIASRAKQSRIDVGHVIVAKKKEGLSGSQSFLFYGRGASVDALRVACEHTNPSRKTRDRCDFAARRFDEQD